MSYDSVWHGCKRRVHWNRPLWGGFCKIKNPRELMIREDGKSTKVK